MEAKDTVMDFHSIDKIVRHTLTDTPLMGELGVNIKVAEAQAEISFKAGRKEVVEWIQQNHQYVGLCYPDAFADWIQIEMDKWQAKLKEWGVDKRYTVAIPPGPDFPNWKQRGIDE